MPNSIKRKTLDALLIALRPLMRLMISAGIGYREFGEIAKAAFVEVATKDHGLRGRPTNISRVAVMTGLTRKEVRRLRDKSDEGDTTEVLKTTPMSEILHRWYTTADYVNETGEPIDLKFSGVGPSFSSLVKLYGGDIPPGAMRTELLRVGAIAIRDDGAICPVKRYITGADIDEKLVIGLSMSIYPTLLTLRQNCDPKNANNTWIQRVAASKHIRSEDMQKIRRISRDRLIEFTESIDDLFGAYETLHQVDKTDMTEADSPPQMAVGVGVFYFEENKLETDIFG